MVVSSLIWHQHLQVIVPNLFHLKLLSECTCFNFKVIVLLDQIQLILFKLRAHSLQAFLVVFDRAANSSVVVDLVLQLVSLLLDFSHCLVGQLKLVSKMVDMSLECLYLWNVILLLLLLLFNHKSRSSHVFLLIKQLLVKLVVFISKLLERLTMPFAFSTDISIVLQHILLLHLKCSHLLLGKSLLVLELIDLLL